MPRLLLQPGHGQILQLEFFGNAGVVQSCSDRGSLSEHEEKYLCYSKMPHFSQLGIDAVLGDKDFCIFGLYFLQ